MSKLLMYVEKIAVLCDNNIELLYKKAYFELTKICGGTQNGYKGC